MYATINNLGPILDRKSLVSLKITKTADNSFFELKLFFLWNFGKIKDIKQKENVKMQY